MIKIVPIDQNLKEMIEKADKMAFSTHDSATANQFLDSQNFRLSKDKTKGRAAGLNPKARFEAYTSTPFDDGWSESDEMSPSKTTVEIEKARSIISQNQSPDLPFDRSINPYRGCEHGCIYCFARPSHSYMGLSAGVDFETRLFAKPDAAKLLERALSKPNYKPKTIAIGTNTDPYQPIEKKWQIMREILKVLDKANHPVSIVTKSSLVVRDGDILAQMCQRKLARVAISLTTLDAKLSRSMEPRAATPARRLWAIQELTKMGVSVSVMVAPIIPGLNDHEIEKILSEAKNHGAVDASYVMLRLPLDVAPLFKDWLLREYPDRYRRVVQLIRDMRGGKDYDADWQTRMKGSGPLADLVERRFRLSCERLELGKHKIRLSHDQFQSPLPFLKQLSLF